MFDSIRNFLGKRAPSYGGIRMNAPSLIPMLDPEDQALAKRLTEKRIDAGNHLRNQIRDVEAAAYRDYTEGIASMVKRAFGIR